MALVQQLAVPAPESVRTHQQVELPQLLGGEVVQERGQQRAVVRRERGRARFALQDRQLVPQRKDLHVLVVVAHRQQAYERERVRQGEIGQS